MLCKNGQETPTSLLKGFWKRDDENNIFMYQQMLLDLNH
jgi:hypothetical protein